VGEDEDKLGEAGLDKLSIERTHTVADGDQSSCRSPCSASSSREEPGVDGR
jgi:hypothetical protein